MNKKIYPYKCDYCGKDFLIDSYTFKKLQTGKQKNCYCSKDCHNMSKRTGKDVKCDYCGKIFHRRQQHIDRSPLNFCSYECNYNYKREHSREIRKCEICGKEFEVLQSSSKRFCSHECQSAWQTTQVGELNSHYSRIEYCCDYCGKPFMVKNYKVEDKSSGKMQHLFCSELCRQKWYAEDFSQTDVVKERSRKIMLDLLSSGKMSTVNSKPQQIIDKMLDDLNINYIREYNIKYYSIDNYLSDANLMIEVMGDYWHCNPLVYSQPMNKTQKSNLRKDKAKHTYVKKYLGIEILYIWESDIYNNSDDCKNLILEYINKNGQIDNYHSFNFGKNENEYVNIGY